MFGRRKRPDDAGLNGDAGQQPDALYARARELRGDYRNNDEVERLLESAAAQGHKVSMFDLGVIAERHSRFADARAWFERASDAGHLLAERTLEALADAERAATVDPGLGRLEEAAGTGDPGAMLQWGVHVRAAGRISEGTGWVERSAATGHREAVRRLASLRARDGDLDEAERLLRDDAALDDVDAGERGGLTALGEFLRGRRPAQAVPVLERLAGLGDVWAPLHLARLHRRAARGDAAEHWLRFAVEASTEASRTATVELGILLLEQGRDDEAEPFLRAAEGYGSDFHLAWLLEGRGQFDDAERLYRELAENDDDQVHAMAGLVRMLERRGETEQARPWRETVEDEGVSLDGPPGPPPSD